MDHYPSFLLHSRNQLWYKWDARFKLSYKGVRKHKQTYTNIWTMHAYIYLLNHVYLHTIIIYCHWIDTSVASTLALTLCRNNARMHLHDCVIVQTQGRSKTDSMCKLLFLLLVCTALKMWESCPLRGEKHEHIDLIWTGFCLGHIQTQTARGWTAAGCK